MLTAGVSNWLMASIIEFGDGVVIVNSLTQHIAPVLVEVRGMPNGIFHPWVRWDSGVEVARKFFRRRRRRRPPQKWVFGDYRFPSFSDT